MSQFDTTGHGHEPVGGPIKFAPINLRNEGDYVHVHLGPIPGAAASSYPFPTVEAARSFAAGAQERDPDREVWVG